MPLVLTLKKGEDFYVGDRRFHLTDITQSSAVFNVDHYGKFIARKTQWDDPIEGVHLLVDRIGGAGFGFIKLAVDAPDYKVLRGKLYRNGSDVNEIASNK